MTPEVAAHATGRPLLASRRGTVLHLALDTRPTCRQRGRRWHTPRQDDPRRLCSRCDAWATHTRPAARWLSASAGDIHAALLAVTDPTELHDLVMAVCARRDLLHCRVLDPVHRKPAAPHLLRLRSARTLHPTHLPENLMAPFWKSLAALLYGLICVAVPFMLGRWTKTTRYCGPCERRMNAAARARSNGESVARLRQRATSPDDVRKQAEEDRQTRLHLLAQGGLVAEQVRGIRL